MSTHFKLFCSILLPGLILHSCKKEPMVTYGERPVKIKIELQITDPNHISPDGYAYFYLNKKRLKRIWGVLSTKDSIIYSAKIPTESTQFCEVVTTSYTNYKGQDINENYSLDQFFCIVTPVSIENHPNYPSLGTNLYPNQATLFTMSAYSHVSALIYLNPTKPCKIYGTFN